MVKKVLSIIVLVLLILAIMGYIISSIQHQQYLSEVERVNIIHLQGPIEESAGGGFMPAAITPAQVSSKLQRAEEDDTIKAVVMRVNSPGGSVSASQEIAQMVKDFPKPLVVSMGDMAASGGYYISSPADAILANRGSITGSIGVILTTFDFNELLDKIGVHMEIIKSGEHKDIMQTVLTDEERELLQNLSDGIYRQFIEDVAVNRDLTIDHVEELATGEVYLGTQALELGLIDHLGGIAEAFLLVSEMANLEDPVKYRYPPPGILEQLGTFATQIPQIIRGREVPLEIHLFERLKENYPFELRYELK